jgi:hypothetical protein
MGIFFDDWQACLRSHYIYVIRAGDGVTEPTLRHVLLHSGVDEAELQALRAQAEALGPLDSDAPADIVRDPAPDAAPAVDPVGDDLAEDRGEIGAADAAFDEVDLPPEEEIGEPDDGRFDEDDEDGIYDDEGDGEPPVASNQLSLF